MSQICSFADLLSYSSLRWSIWGVYCLGVEQRRNVRSRQVEETKECPIAVEAVALHDFTQTYHGKHIKLINNFRAWISTIVYKSL